MQFMANLKDYLTATHEVAKEAAKISIAFTMYALERYKE